MSKYTISQASIIVDKGITTLNRHIEQGRLSVQKNDKGHRIIDGAELARAYPDDCDFSRTNQKEGSKTNRSETAITAELQRLLEEVTKSNTRERQQFQARIERLEKDKDQAHETYQHSLRLLEDKSAQTDELKRQAEEWSRGLEAMRQRQANSDKEIKHLRRLLLDTQRQPKSFWLRLFG